MRPAILMLRPFWNVLRFYRSHEHRTCKGCGHLNPAPARYEPENA